MASSSHGDTTSRNAPVSVVGSEPAGFILDGCACAAIAVKHNIVAARRTTRIGSLLIFRVGECCLGSGMPGQSGANLMKTGEIWINRGRGCRASP
jgi:hypothetical protein